MGGGGGGAGGGGSISVISGTAGSLSFKLITLLNVAA